MTDTHTHSKAHTRTCFTLHAQVKELEAGAILGQIAVSANESLNMLFAGTSERNKPGVVRAYNFPLTGDFLEFPCMAAPITRM